MIARLAPVFAAALLSATIPGLAQDHPASQLPVPNSTLSLEERAKAVAVALPQQAAVSSLTLSQVGAPNRVVVSNVQAIDETKAEGRQALVTIYQYQDNVTLRRLVDLKESRIVSEERSTQSTPPLAPVEQDYARALLLANERVAQLLGPMRDVTKTEFLLTHTSAPDSPFYGKRVVGALFRTPRGYLANAPKVFVNLTDGAVVLQD
jgi:Cu2+-containing amine oxidase